MAINPWVLPEGFDADTRKAIKALLDALKKSGATIPEDAYTQLRLGNIDEFLAFVDWGKIRGGFGDLRSIMEETARKAGQSTFKLGGVDATLLFDLIDERAVIYAQERVGELIVEITDQMRETVRNTIAQATAGEMTYQQAALRLQSTIPLTTRDSGAVDKFIDKQFQRFMGSGFSEARARVKAQNMGGKYAAKLLDSRTRTIARTEIADAAMNGRYLGWDAGVTAGYISNDSVKEWIAEPDACEICSPLDGTLIGWNADWAFPEGVSAGTNNRMPPAHPNCRCSVAILPPDYADNVFTPSSGGEMPEEADEFMKHMGGQHDQSSHGRKGSIKSGFKNWNPYVFDLLESAEEIDESRGDGINVVFTEAAGFNAKPQILTQTQFDAIESETLYRGVQGEEFVADFKESTVQYGGTGSFGNGTYLSNDANTVVDYGGSIMEMKLLPTANVVTFESKDNLKTWTANLTNEWLESYKTSGANPYEMQQAQWNLGGSTTNWTAIAMMQGIDAVQIPQGNGEFYTVLLNRGQVAINGDS
jgi:hypothetical protein